MNRSAFAREPSEPEIADALAFVESQKKEPGSSEASAWKDYAHVLLNLKEFIYIK